MDGGGSLWEIYRSRCSMPLWTVRQRGCNCLSHPRSCRGQSKVINGMRRACTSRGSLRPVMSQAASSQSPQTNLWTPAVDRKAVLVADIGGTNCRFVLCETEDNKASRLILNQTYQTKEYPTFEDALDAFSQQPDFSANAPSAAAFAVAGPVASNRCVMTNLAWTIDGNSLAERYGIKFAILNDFVANGYGVPTLTSNDTLTLNDVPAVDKAPIVVMGPGTGLGQAFLIWTNSEGRYDVLASEGAHATYGPNGWKQVALHNFVEERLGQCETEYVKIACGSGLELIYEFLASGSQESPHTPKRQLKSAPSITQSALDESDPLAVETVDLFLAIIGNEAGGNALRVLARGGVYLCGGILPRLKDRITNGALLEGFLNRKSRFAPVLAEMPLHLVLDTGLGIRGAINFASQLSERS